LRFTLDYPEDLEVIESIFAVFEPNTFFSLEDVLALQKARPELFAENAKFTRNAGLSMTQGQKMWSRAKRIIPGGSMLLSKRPEMYAPDYWPPYFKEARGCHVWDVDGREFVDVSMMGVGTNLLGYGRPEVDEAVRQAVNAGVSSTLNCHEELTLAERLISMHPWASKVRLARTGGEANAIAVRIARAATGKHQIAFCGYHGWHDWYLSANLAEGQALDGHLLPGLDPIGVPRGLLGTTFPFPYNDSTALEALLAEHHDIGTVVMEVQRTIPPNPGFLAKVRSIADRNGLVLIFDECTSAFRENFGGLHLKYGVSPDLATLGKALGNGYAITAVIGRSAVMSVAEESFISSTFWTERIGPCAALATLRVMEDTQSWEVVSEIGRYMKRLWTHLIDENSLNAGVGGLDALATLNFESSKALGYKTLISQQLLQSGYLAATSFYASTAHNPEILDAYGENLSKTFDLIRQCEEGRPIDQLLVGPMAHAGFKRLT
jgi:glutamate-1-semialdehyde 2,1-aminomutase